MWVLGFCNKNEDAVPLMYTKNVFHISVSDNCLCVCLQVQLHLVLLTLVLVLVQSIWIMFNVVASRVISLTAHTVSLSAVLVAMERMLE